MIEEGQEMKFWIWAVFMTFYFAGSLFSQEPDTLWTRIHSISPNGDIDEGRCVRQTADGGYIITGSTVPDGMVSHIDVLLLKTDAEGNALWIRTYGGEFVEDGFAVEPTDEGGYIIAGRALIFSDTTRVMASLTETNWPPHHSDAWLLKTNQNGDTLWTRKYGGEGHDYITSVYQTVDQGYILAGAYNADHSYPNYEIDENYLPASSRAWLIKTAANGDTLWTRQFRSRSQANRVIVTSDGGYLFAGWIFPELQSNQSDVYVVKTDASGDTLWTRIIGGSASEIGLSVCEIADGYIIAGQVKPAGLPYDALLVKTGFTGEVQWVNTFGGTRSDAAFTVEPSRRGILVTGNTNGNWWIHQGDGWIFEVDGSGNLLWEKVYNVRLSDYAFCGIQNAEGDFLISGMVSHGFGGDLWLAKVGSVPSGIDEGEKMARQFRLFQNFPNPFNPSTTISWQLEKESWINLTLFNLAGQQVAVLVNERQRPGFYLLKFDSSQLPSGVYFYRLEAGEYSQTLKMLLMK